MTTMRRLPEQLRSPISIPEATCCDFQIKHVMESQFPIISGREAMMTGKRPAHVKLDKPIRIHQLLQNNALWMSDVPIEIRQAREAVSEMSPYGRVLIGGLGLGIIATMMSKVPPVTHVDVVERSSCVAHLVVGCSTPPYTVILKDIYAFIRELPRWDYDGAFFDTWRGTDEATWWEEVFPIRRIIGQRFGARALATVHCWAEDIMIGQIMRRFSEDTLPHWYYREQLRLPMTLDRAAQFFRTIGTPAWEKRYGDAYPLEIPSDDEAQTA